MAELQNLESYGGEGDAKAVALLNDARDKGFTITPFVAANKNYYSVFKGERDGEHEHAEVSLDGDWPEGFPQA